VGNFAIFAPSNRLALASALALEMVGITGAVVGSGQWVITVSHVVACSRLALIGTWPMAANDLRTHASKQNTTDQGRNVEQIFKHLFRFFRV
jgi:hypothetical protein